MGESFKSQCFTHPLRNLSSVVSRRCLGHTELDFGLRQSLKWEVGCELHHPRKIPERLDASLSHSSLLLSSRLLTFTSCKLWTTAIVPSCLDKRASGGGRKALPVSHPFLKDLFGLEWGRGGAKSHHTTSFFLLFAWTHCYVSPERSTPPSPCGWSRSQISPQFAASLARLYLKIHVLVGSISTGLRLTHHPQSGTLCGST